MSHQQFDEHIKNHLGTYQPVVPNELWQKIATARGYKKPSKSIVPLDNYVAEQLDNYHPTVPAHVYDNITEQRFDNYFNSTLTNYQPAVPAAIWSAIASDRKKKRRPVFWYWFGRAAIVASLLLLSVGGYFYFTTKSSTHKNNTTTATQNNDALIVSNELPAVPNNNSSIVTSNVQQSLVPTQQSVYSPLNGAEIFTNNNSRINVAAPIFTNENETTAEDLFNTDAVNRGYNDVTPFTALKSNGLNINTKKTVFATMPDCPVNPSDRISGSFVEVYAGPDYAFENLNDLKGNTTYLQSRKNATSFASAYSAGIRYNKLFNNGTSFKVGANYSQINETLKVLQGGIIQVVYILNAIGDTIGSYTVNGSRYQKIHNRYRTIDIPIQMGYEINASEKINVNISAGPVVNIRSWQKGSTLDTAGNVVPITTGKATPEYKFKTNMGVGFMGSATVYYKLKDKQTMLFAEPYFRYNIASMNDTQHSTIKQKYNTAGVRIGVRLKL